MRLLAHGEPVTSIALEVGYESPSAFIAAFSHAFGTTPGRFYGAGHPGARAADVEHSGGSRAPARSAPWRSEGPA